MVGVTEFRHHVLQHRRLVACLIALALLMKVLVPTGYMLGTSAGSITVELCSGYGPMTMRMPGMAHHQSENGGHGKAEQPCAFSGLSAPLLGVADPTLLALVLAFIVATAFRASARDLVQTPAFLRPPTTGPPAHT